MYAKRLLCFSLGLNAIFFLLMTYWASKNWAKLVSLFNPNPVVSVVMFGDSITSLGDWKSLIGRDDVANSGNPALTTSHFVSRVRSQVINHDPKICYFLGGVNDVGVGIPLHRTLSNIETIVDSLIKYDIDCVLQSVIYTSSISNNYAIDSLNLGIKRIASQKKVDYLDLNKRLSYDHFINSSYTTDGVHLNRDGYVVWSNIIIEDLKKRDRD